MSFNFNFYIPRKSFYDLISYLKTSVLKTNIIRYLPWLPKEQEFIILITLGLYYFSNEYFYHNYNSIVLLIGVFMEELEMKLDSDKLREVIRKIEEEAQKKFAEGEPYYIVRLRWLRKKLEGTRGVAFILRNLNKKFSVDKDGSWIVLRPKEDSIE